MKNKYEEMKIHFNSLEWVICEMELKVSEMRIKKPDFDFKDSEIKIKALKMAQDYIYQEFEEYKKLQIRNSELNLINQKLNLCKK